MKENYDRYKFAVDAEEKMYNSNMSKQKNRLDKKSKAIFYFINLQNLLHIQLEQQ